MTEAYDEYLRLGAEYRSLYYKASRTPEEQSRPETLAVMGSKLLHKLSDEEQAKQWGPPEPWPWHPVPDWVLEDRLLDELGLLRSKARDNRSEEEPTRIGAIMQELERLWA